MPTPSEALRRMRDELTLRMCGDNVTMMRCAWLDLLDELREDSELATRVRKLVEQEPQGEPPNR